MKGSTVQPASWSDKELSIHSTRKIAEARFFFFQLELEGWESISQAQTQSSLQTVISILTGTFKLLAEHIEWAN